MRQAHDAHREGNTLSFVLAGNASPIPPLKYPSQGFDEVAIEVETLGEALSNFAEASIFLIHQLGRDQDALGDDAGKLQP